MAKASWGIKRTCPCGNGVRFYDLNKKEIECPSCGENINIEQLSISILENNLRKKPQVALSNETKSAKKEYKEKSKNKTHDVEVDTDVDPKIEVEEIIGEKIKKKKKEED